MSPHEISWIPAHPSYGSVSMNRYASLLANARQPGDRFSCQLLVAPDGDRGAMVSRQLHRRILYPFKVRAIRGASVAHILDHSWSDLLNAVPRGVKTVVTVHDLIPLRYPGELKPAQLGRFKVWVSHIKRADAIIAVSEYTKAEIVGQLGIPPSKITVVPNGVEIPESQGGRTRIAGDAFVIGSIGSLLLRKNLGIFPEALKSLVSSLDVPVRLVRVGAILPENLASAITAAIGAENLIELGKVPDEALADFYGSVDCVAFPSLYEGFGLPVLEAMASRVPVVCSNSSSLPEVGGDAPEYFDPSSPEQLAAALRVIATQGMDPGRIEKGFRKAESMSWRKALEAYHGIYDSLIG